MQEKQRCMILFFQFFNHFLCRFAFTRWPPRRVTALQVVRTSFLGVRARLSPPPVIAITFFPFLPLKDRNFLYHLFGLLAPGFMSRESGKFTGILQIVQLSPVPVFVTKENTSTIWRKIFTEVSIQMVSTQGDIFFVDPPNRIIIPFTRFWEDISHKTDRKFNRNTREMNKLFVV